MNIPSSSVVARLCNANVYVINVKVGYQKHQMSLQSSKVKRTRICGAGLGVQQLGVPLPYEKGCYHLVAGLWFTVQLVG